MHLPFTKLCDTRPRNGRWLLAWWLAVAVAAVAGCGKDTAHEASDSDANGYLCVKCDAKLYASRSEFLGPKCPKCQQDALVEVVGYFCAKDQHLTLRGRSDDRGGAATCEKCSAPLGGMRLPREKDLQTWGATRVPN